MSRTNLMINLGYVIKAREILALGEHMKSLLLRGSSRDVPEWLSRYWRKLVFLG